MKDVAGEAGVAQALLHYYFDTRERLFAEVVTRMLDDHLERFRADLAIAGDERRQELGLRVLRRKVIGPRRVWRLLFEVLANASRDHGERVLAERFTARRALMAKAIGGRDAAARALVLDALMLGLAAERLAGASHADVEAAIAVFAELAK